MNEQTPLTEPSRDSQIVYVSAPTNGKAVTAFIFSLLIASIVLSGAVLMANSKARNIASIVDYSIVQFRRDMVVSPRDATAMQLVIVTASWLILLAVILVFWILVSEIIVWYVGLITGLAVAAFAVFIVPTLLNMDISELQSIDLRAVAGKAFWPIITLVAAGLIWWVVYLLALAALATMSVQRSRVAIS